MHCLNSLICPGFPSSKLNSVINFQEIPGLWPLDTHIPWHAWNKQNTIYFFLKVWYVFFFIFHRINIKIFIYIYLCRKRNSKLYPVVQNRPRLWIASMPLTLKCLVVTKGYLNKLAGLLSMYELLFTNRQWNFHIFLVNPLVHAVLKGHTVFSYGFVKYVWPSSGQEAHKG